MKANKFYIGLLVLLSFLASSYIEKKVSEPDYFVFGLLYGQCKSGECIKIYKIENSTLQLYKEDTSHYPPFNTFHSGNYKELSKDKYKQVRTIISKIPQQLILTQSGTIGTLDDMKQDMLYFEYAENGIKKFWVIDPNKKQLPAYLHPFIDDIDRTVKLLEQ
ncbi:hypothetical protein ACXYMU_01135 [Pontibacter sp. CAU 1760]